MAGRNKKDPKSVEVAWETKSDGKRRGKVVGPSEAEKAKAAKKKTTPRKKRQTIKDGPGRLSAAPGTPYPTGRLDREFRDEAANAAHEEHLAELKVVMDRPRRGLSQKKFENGLTYNQMLFVEAYCRDPNGNQLIMLTAAGYRPSSEASAHTTFQKLLSKPEIKAAIEAKFRSWRDILDGKSREFVTKVLELATFDVKEVYKVENGRMLVHDTAGMSFAARNMVDSIKFKPGEFGDEWSVSMRDRKYYIDTVLKWLNVNDKSTVAPASVYPQQAQALKDIRSGAKTPIEAALDLEIDGIPLPDTIKTLLARPEIAVAMKQEVVIDVPTPEEIAERRRKLLAEVEDQKMNFLPSRQEEVRAIKADLGTANGAFDVTPE